MNISSCRMIVLSPQPAEHLTLQDDDSLAMRLDLWSYHEVLSCRRMMVLPEHLILRPYPTPFLRKDDGLVLQPAKHIGLQEDDGLVI